MKKYIGTKQIEAEPMTMGEAYRRGLLHAGRVPSESEKSKAGYYVKYDNGYESWSPADVFEKAYKLADTYARELLTEAARLLSIRCPRCARARLRRIAQHDVEVYGADYEETLRDRQNELYNLFYNID